MFSDIRSIGRAGADDITFAVAEPAQCFMRTTALHCKKRSAANLVAQA